MAVALSPWPTDPTDLQSAIACLKEAIGAHLSDARFQALGEVTAELVERYGPEAPQGIRNEALLRCAGWLAQQPNASIRSERVGDISTGYSPMLTGALRYSGAMSLLSPFKIRRGGLI